MDWISLAGTISSALLSGAALVIVAIINNRGKEETKSNAEQRERQEKRAKRRETETRLSMELMSSTSELSDVIAIAVSGGHINGNVEAARKKAQTAREAYENFIKDEASKACAKE